MALVSSIFFALGGFLLTVASILHVIDQLRG